MLDWANSFSDDAVIRLSASLLVNLTAQAKAGMDEHAKLRSLLDIAESLGMRIRRAPSGTELDAAAGGAEHPGGALVRLRDHEMLFLDPTASVADRIAVVAAALAGRAEIEQMYLPPEIRELIERA